MRDMKYKTLILLIILQIVLSESAKTNTRPVYEVNEQMKTEEKKAPNVLGSLPYGNPLAGNLLQSAKLHAQNQQAMFQAERVRQHRAQLQRWTKQNLPTDSYMKAYHETQESHQLAIERQESMVNEKKITLPTNKENRKRIKIPELTKITKEDAVIDPEKRRNHRSYGTNEYKRYYQPTKHQNIYVSQGPSYDQGISINPNGITYLNPKEPNKLYPETVENKMQYAYPSHNQIRYEFVRDISSLNALLNKSPQDQLNGLNAITHIEKEPKGSPETPLNVYTYVKELQPTENYKETYTRNPQNYANTFTDDVQVKDHTPINEYVDDIEDPNKSTTIKAFGLQNVLTTQQPEEETSTRNYLNAITQPVEYNFNVKVEEEYPQTYQILKEEQPVYFSENVQDSSDPGRIYLDENNHPKGVQHLKEDGQQISAYSEENLQYASSYEFGYRVRDEHSGNYYGHHELKKDGKTNGHYHVLLPDGRMQKVKYYAGPGGFHADISYDHLK